MAAIIVSTDAEYLPCLTRCVTNTQILHMNDLTQSLQLSKVVGVSIIIIINCIVSLLLLLLLLLLTPFYS